MSFFRFSFFQLSSSKKFLIFSSILSLFRIISIILIDLIAFVKPVELSHFKTIKPFWPTVIFALVDVSIVCITESVRYGIVVEDILINSPESIRPKFSPTIVSNGSLEPMLAILAKTTSPMFNFNERSSRDAE